MSFNLSCQTCRTALFVCLCLSVISCAKCRSRCHCARQSVTVIHRVKWPASGSRGSAAASGRNQTSRGWICGEFLPLWRRSLASKGHLRQFITSASEMYINIHAVFSLPVGMTCLEGKVKRETRLHCGHDARVSLSLCLFISVHTIRLQLMGFTLDSSVLVLHSFFFLHKAFRFACER